FSADAWFSGLKAGHTFITVGPMLEFSVNDQTPGTTITPKPGDVLRIRAAASGGPAPPHYLEIVEQGNVIRSVKDEKNQLSLEFTIPVQRSTWITARCAGALTTPVYIRVGEERFWNLSLVEPLIEKRVQQLEAIDNLLST